MEQIQGAVYYKNLEHEGFEIHFPGEPSQEVLADLKRWGYRWSRRQRIWYAKDHPHTKMVADKYAEYGGEVGEPLTIEEKVERKIERSEARAARYEAKAEKAEQMSDALYNQAHEMADVIPLGQPILVGHHSEKSDRSYRNRIHLKFTKAFEESDKAKFYKQKAIAASGYEDRMMNTTTVMNRIEKLEAEWRRNHRDLDYQNEAVKRGYTDTMSRKSLERAEAEMDRLDKEITYWKAFLAKNQRKIWTREEFKKDDLIKVRKEICIVEKVNDKTISVRFVFRPYDDYFSTWKIKYQELHPSCKEVPEDEAKYARDHMAEIRGARKLSKKDFQPGEVVKTSMGIALIESVGPRGLYVKYQNSIMNHIYVKYHDLKNDCKDVPDEQKNGLIEALAAKDARREAIMESLG